MEIIRPRQLQMGDTIGIIAPSIGMKPEYITDSLTSLQTQGFHYKLAEHLYADTYGYAASPEERAADLHAMIQDPEVKMILFGGGEVCNEILPYLDWDCIRANPKILCSYSDSTSLLNPVTAMTGLVTFYGQSLRTFSALDPYNLQSFRDRLMSGSTAYREAAPWKVLVPGRCRGVLTGGYLVNYAALQGLPWFRLDKEKNYLLFLEDHEKFSAPAAVSKWLTHLEFHGVFNRITGLIFGQYSAAEQPHIDQILTRLGEKYHIPVVRCEDFGHGRYNSILPIGISAELDTKEASFVFQQPGVL